MANVVIPKYLGSIDVNNPQNGIIGFDPFPYLQTSMF